MNLGGIKISSIALENVLVRHPMISRECAAISYRKEQIDSESLVVCVVPKKREQTFTVNFKTKPLGLQLAPVKNPDITRTLVYSVESPSSDDEKEEKEKEKEKRDDENGDRFDGHENQLKGAVVYRINGEKVLSEPFESVIQTIQSASLPLTIQFLRQVSFHSFFLSFPPSHLVFFCFFIVAI